jgi:hypothetical protein
MYFLDVLSFLLFHLLLLILHRTHMHARMHARARSLRRSHSVSLVLAWDQEGRSSLPMIPVGDTLSSIAYYSFLFFHFLANKSRVTLLLSLRRNRAPFSFHDRSSRRATSLRLACAVSRVIRRSTSDNHAANSARECARESIECTKYKIVAREYGNTIIAYSS